MKTVLKIIFSVLAVAVLCVGGVTAYNYFTQKPFETTYEITDDFSALDIDVSTADVEILHTDGGAKIVCTETKDKKYELKLENDALSVDYKDGRNFIKRIGIDFTKMTVKVYLPKTVYNKLEIDTDTGNVSASSDFLFETIDIDTDTGNVDLDGTDAETVYIETDTGNVVMNHTSATKLTVETDTGNITAKRGSYGEVDFKTDTGNVRFEDTFTFVSLRVRTDTGNVNFDGADAPVIDVKTDTGNVKGILYTDKIFQTKTSTGKVQVPSSTIGGLCKIETSTGDISIRIGE